MALVPESPYSADMGMTEYYTRIADLRDSAKAEVNKVVVGQDEAVDLMLIAAVAHGHVLVEGPPGSAKTLLAKPSFVMSIRSFIARSCASIWS